MYKPLSWTRLALSVFYFWLKLMWGPAPRPRPRWRNVLSQNDYEIIRRIFPSRLTHWQNYWRASLDKGYNSVGITVRIWSHRVTWHRNWKLKSLNNIKERTRWIKASKQGRVLPALCNSFIQHCFGATRLHGMKATERTKNAKFSRNVRKYRICFFESFLSIASCDLQTPNQFPTALLLWTNKTHLFKNYYII